MDVDKPRGALKRRLRRAERRRPLEIGDVVKVRSGARVELYEVARVFTGMKGEEEPAP